MLRRCIVRTHDGSRRFRRLTRESYPFPIRILCDCDPPVFLLKPIRVYIVRNIRGDADKLVTSVIVEIKLYDVRESFSDDVVIRNCVPILFCASVELWAFAI